MDAGQRAPATRLVRAACVLAVVLGSGCTELRPHAVEMTIDGTPSAPPCPAPMLDTGAWRDEAVPIPEGVFGIRLPKGWTHTRSTPGLFPRGTDGPGPFWSTLWTTKQGDSFHQWVQPGGELPLEGRVPRDAYMTTAEYRVCREGADDSPRTYEALVYRPKPGTAVREGFRRYGAAVAFAIGPGRWAVISADLHSRRAQEEFLAAARTARIDAR